MQYKKPWPLKITSFECSQQIKSVFRFKWDGLRMRRSLCVAAERLLLAIVLDWMIFIFEFFVRFDAMNARLSSIRPFQKISLPFFRIVIKRVPSSMTTPIIKAPESCARLLFFLWRVIDSRARRDCLGESPRYYNLDLIGRARFIRGLFPGPTSWQITSQGNV